MKKLAKTISAIMFLLAFINSTYAQVAGDYRSIASGDWNTVSNWQIYSTSLGWSAATSKPGSTRNVIIQSGHTITLSSTNTCKNLTIENGGVLDATASSSIRIGGVAGMDAILQNDGILGNTVSNSLLIVEVPVTAASLTIQGTGVTKVSRLRLLGGNAQACTLTINQDVTVVGESVGAFTAFANSGNLTTDNYTVTINSGKTVTLLNPNTYFHSSSDATAVNGGNYTYNINGTLDLTNTTVSSNIIPNSLNSLSNVTLNISGVVKLGTGLNLVNSAPSPSNNGKVAINITSGGVIDATNTTTLNYGDNYFKLAGTGKLKRKVDNSDVVFPIGLASSTEPNFVTLNNSGTLTNFTVELASAFTVAPTETKVVNREWTITPEISGAIASIKLGWGTTAQASGFNPANAVALIRYNGTSWDEITATGAGPDVNNLYAATSSGVSNFGAFSVQNTTTLPLKLVNFTAKLNKNLANKVDLNWQTQNEVNTGNFAVERSSNGKDFAEITLIKSANTSGNHSYNYTDLNPLSGVSYYRIKQIDLDGKFDYSATKAVENYITNFVIYPNPVVSSLQITHPESNIGDDIKIVNTIGSVVKIITPVYLSNYTSVDLSALTPGVYFACMQNNGKISSLKFIKK